MPVKIADGIIHPEIFSSQKIKLLCILKEANDKTSTEDWDMCDSDKEGLFNYSKWKATFGLLCKLSYAILEPEKTYDEVNNYDDETLACILDKVAYINIKKVSGGSVVNLNDFNKYIKDGSYLTTIQNQIKEINPNIVYCAGTFEYVFAKLPNFNLYDDWIYEKNGIKYINGWHTNVRKNHKQIYNDLKKQLNKQL